MFPFFLFSGVFHMAHVHVFGSIVHKELIGSLKLYQHSVRPDVTKYEDDQYLRFQGLLLYIKILTIMSKFYVFKLMAKELVPWECYNHSYFQLFFFKVVVKLCRQEKLSSRISCSLVALKTINALDFPPNFLLALFYLPRP